MFSFHKHPGPAKEPEKTAADIPVTEKSAAAEYYDERFIPIPALDKYACMFDGYRTIHPVRRPKPEKISLYHYDVTGFSDGEPVCIGGYGYYNAADENVYIEEYGPGKKEVRKVPVPQNVEKTKDSIMEYLRKNAGVYIPMGF